jgi:hypothetical protein
MMLNEDIVRDIIIPFLDSASIANLHETDTSCRNAVKDFLEEKYGSFGGRFVALAKYHDRVLCHRICTREGCTPAMEMYTPRFRSATEFQQFLYALGRGGIHPLFKVFNNGPGMCTSRIALSALKNNPPSAALMLRELLPTGGYVHCLLRLAVEQNDADTISRLPECYVCKLTERQCTRLLLMAVANRRAITIDALAQRLAGRFATDARYLEAALESRNEEGAMYILTHSTVPYVPDEFDAEVGECNRFRSLLRAFCARHSLFAARPEVLGVAYAIVCLQDGSADFLRECVAMSLEQQERDIVRKELSKSYWPLYDLPEKVQGILEKSNNGLVCKHDFVERWGMSAFLDILSIDDCGLIGKARELSHWCWSREAIMGTMMLLFFLNTGVQLWQMCSSR